MEKLVDLYFSHVETSFAKGSYSRDLYELLFLGRLSAYMNQFGVKILDPDNVLHNTSLVTLALAPSGAGKDSAIRFISPLEDKISEVFEQLFCHKRQILLDANGESDSEDKSGDGRNFTQSKPKQKKDRKRPLKESLPSEHIMFAKSLTVAAMDSFFMSYSQCGFGSLNLSSTEFGQSFKDRNFKEILEKYLELWDSSGRVASRLTDSKGSISFENQGSCSLHGAFDEFKSDSKMIEDLQIYLSTSLSRRGLFVNIENDESLKYFKFKLKNNKKKMEEYEKENLSEEDKKKTVKNTGMSSYMEALIKRIFYDVISPLVDKFSKSNNLNKDDTIKRPDIVLKFTKGAEILLHKYKSHCDLLALKAIEDCKVESNNLKIEFSSRGAKAMRLAGISAFYNGRNLINEEDIRYGCRFVQKSGDYFASIIKPNILVDSVCDALIKTKNKQLTVRDLQSMGAIPQNISQSKLNDLFMRCKEELFSKNIIFRSTMGSSSRIQQVWVERLIETEGNIAHISYSTEENMADSYMKTVSIPIDEILNIPNIKKIGVGGFRDNARSIDNVAQLGNVIIFDMDSGETTIKEAFDSLRGLTGFIYPTKSHRKPKRIKTGKKDSLNNDIFEDRICDRFRIVLLCKYHFPFGEDKQQANDEYKSLYAEIAKHFSFKFDQNAMSSSHFYWIPESAKTDRIKKIGKINGNNLLDLTHFIPDLKIHTDIMNSSKAFNSQKYWKDQSVKEILERGLRDVVIKGSRNCSLFSMCMSLKDKGLSYDEIKSHALDVNDKFKNPLDEKEIEISILTSVKKRIDKK